jgi:hypothetical protein
VSKEEKKENKKEREKKKKGVTWARKSSKSSKRAWAAERNFEVRSFAASAPRRRDSESEFFRSSGLSQCFNRFAS